MCYNRHGGGGGNPPREETDEDLEISTLIRGCRVTDASPKVTCAGSTYGGHVQHLPLLFIDEIKRGNENLHCRTNTLQMQQCSVVLLQTSEYSTTVISAPATIKFYPELPTMPVPCTL